MNIKSRAVRIASLVVISALMSGCKGETLQEKVSYGFKQTTEFVSDVGAKIGDKLGVELKKEEAAEVEQTTAGALNKAKDGETVVWSNGDGVNAKFTPSNSRTEKRSMRIARLKGVQPPEELDLIGQPYRIIVRSAKVRAAWTTKSKWVRSVAQDNIVTVIGQVRGTNWYMVSKANRAIGYIRNDLMSPATEMDIARAKQIAEVYRKQQSKPESVPSTEIAKTSTDQPAPSDAPAEEGFDLDAVETEQVSLRESEAIDLDAMFEEDEEVVVDEIAANTACRDMTAEVDNKSESSEKTFTVCKAADGAWEL